MCMLAQTAFGQSNLTIPRFPAISPDGNQIAFCYQGDVWTTPANSAQAQRLTIHEAYESRPQWNLTGDQLLFISERYGNADIFVMTDEGTQIQQKTFFSGSDQAAKWAPNNTILFNSNRAFRAVERVSEIMKLDPNFSTPYREMDALGNNPAMSPDGRYIAFERGHCRITREAYRGPANRDIWIYDLQTGKYNQVTSDEGQDIYPDWGPNNTLYYLSAQSGRYNIYSAEVNNGNIQGQPAQLTTLDEEGIRYFDAASNSNWLVYEYGTSIYRMRTDSPSPVKVNLSLPTDFRFDPVERKTYSGQAEDLSISPNGKLMAFSIRGEIFVSPTDKEKKRSQNISNHTYRDQNPQWLNDSTIIFMTDRAGHYDLAMVQSSDPAASSLLKSLKRETKLLTTTPIRELDFALSPDRTKIALVRDRGKLIVADIDESGIRNEIVLLDGWASPSDLNWSPDSKWLAYSLEDLTFNEEVYLHPIDQHQPPINISMHPRVDGDPIWSADGRKVGFLSQRNNGDRDVWFVWLRKSDWEKTQRDWEDADPPAKKKDDKVEVIIDAENIYQRLVQVTNLPGNESQLSIAPDSEHFYFSTNAPGRNGGPDERPFYRVKWDGSGLTELNKDLSIRNSTWADKDELFFISSRGSIRQFSGKSKRFTAIPFSANLVVDHIEERKQIFEDGWRFINDDFYDPDFHGQDWEALKEKYRPRALNASTAQDFADMFNEMLGQLNASHMGIRNVQEPESTQRQRTGRLGVEVTPVENGVAINHVVPNTASDREDSKLIAGDVITAINGMPLTPDVNLYSLLEGTANERTLLSIIRAGKSEELVIRPSTSISTPLYEAWVAQNKALTESYSDGRLGYIHIRGMNWTSFERFERELTASGLGKEGIVIDVRYNGGGWTTDMLLTILNVRQHAYTIPRGAAQNLEREHQSFTQYYPYGERLPFSGLVKPSITLCNEASYSNAEIFSHAYKTLDIGTLVGKATFGAVISTGSRRLIDGSYVRMPYRAWYVSATEENMENGPAVPDIIVENAPDSRAQGEDAQLKKAVETLLSEISQR